MIRRQSLILLATLLVATTAFAGGGIPFTQNVSGSLADTQTDVDDDGGTTATIGQLGGESSLGGPITAQTFTELASAPGPNTDCLPSEVQVPFVHASAVERFTNLGALLYLVMNPAEGGHACVDPTTGAINGTISLVIIGGTGPASSATGTADFDFSGAAVGVFGGNVFHTSLTGTVSGVLVP